MRREGDRKDTQRVPGHRKVRRQGKARRQGILLPDTHAHLDDPSLRGDIEAVLRRALEVGVDRVLAVGSDAESSEIAVELANRHEMVWAAVGIHPHETGKFEDEWEQVKGLLTEPKVVAVGEIGLDFRRDVPREVQDEAFREQAIWAREHGMPISVHNRGADREVLEVIRNTGVRAILHCFSGHETFGRDALDAGCYLSFAGNLTFPKADALRAVAGGVPLDRLLVETDSPVLAPQPVRGRRNEPAHVVMVAERLAETRSEEPDALAAAVTDNADRLFGWNRR